MLSTLDAATIQLFTIIFALMAVSVWLRGVCSKKAAGEITDGKPTCSTKWTERERLELIRWLTQDMHPSSPKVEMIQVIQNTRLLACMSKEFLEQHRDDMGSICRITEEKGDRHHG